MMLYDNYIKKPPNFKERLRIAFINPLIFIAHVIISTPVMILATIFPLWGIVWVITGWSYYNWMNRLILKGD